MTALVKGLIRMGFKENQVEVHKEADYLYGYKNDRRPEKANVIIRRQHVGTSSNDIGFARTSDGSYQAIISEFDSGKGSYSHVSGKYGDKWMSRLTQFYGVERAKAELTYKKIRFVEDMTDKNCPRLRVKF